MDLRFGGMVINLKRRGMGRNPFILFTSSKSSIECYMNGKNWSVSSGVVPSLALSVAQIFMEACMNELIGYINRQLGL